MSRPHARQQFGDLPTGSGYHETNHLRSVGSAAFSETRSFFMMTPVACPISYERVDHNASRVTCLFTIVALALISGMAAVAPKFSGLALLLAGALALDYALRTWTKWSSPMQRIARALARAMGIAEKPSDAAPKRFACRVGFFFALAIVVLLPLAPAVAAVTALALLSFNVLDGVFDFCVGCWMYTTLLLPRRSGS